MASKVTLEPDTPSQQRWNSTNNLKHRFPNGTAIPANSTLHWCMHITVIQYVYTKPIYVHVLRKQQVHFQKQQLHCWSQGLTKDQEEDKDSQDQETKDFQGH